MHSHRHSHWSWIALFVLALPLVTYGQQAPTTVIDGFHPTPPTYHLVDNPNPTLEQLITGLEAASQKTPNDADTWYQLGLSYVAYHQLEKAVGALNKAVQIKPDNAQMWLNLGCAKIKQGEV